MKVVLQKTNGVSLQVDPEEDKWVSIGNGVIVFVSFLKGASEQVLESVGQSVNLSPHEQTNKQAMG